MPKVMVNSLSLYYEAAGEGEPVLFISGLGGDHTGWVSQVAEFSKHYRCITYDNRDAGQSDKASGNYTIRDMAQDAVGLLDALGVISAHIVGNSMGGAIAQELALNSPDRVRSLTLVCTYTKGDPRGTSLMNSWKLMKAKFSKEEYLQAILPWVFTCDDYQVHGRVEDYIQRVLENPYPQSAEAFARQAEAVLSYDGEERLLNIKVPTLIIGGGNDILTPNRFVRAMRKRIPHARVSVVRGAGHGLIYTHPRQFNRTLREFLGSHARKEARTL